MWLEILFVQLALFTAKASVIFEDCGSAYELEAVHIDGCNNRLPCYVTLGEDVPVNIEFVADFVSIMLDQLVVININLVNLRTDAHPPLCDILDCPLATNAKTSITSQISIPTDMALNQRGYLKWQVYNESGKQVLCYSVLVQTQSPLQKLLRSKLLY